MTRPLDGHEWHSKSDAELLFIARDAHEAAQNMRGMDAAAECKYLDQVNDAVTIMAYRRRGGCAPLSLAISRMNVQARVAQFAAEWKRREGYEPAPFQKAIAMQRLERGQTIEEIITALIAMRI